MKKIYLCSTLSEVYFSCLALTWASLFICWLLAFDIIAKLVPQSVVHHPHSSEDATSPTWSLSLQKHNNPNNQKFSCKITRLPEIKRAFAKSASSLRVFASERITFQMGLFSNVSFISDSKLLGEQSSWVLACLCEGCLEEEGVQRVGETRATVRKWQRAGEITEQVSSARCPGGSVLWFCPL